jgi:antitoxin component of MazEF toxin-antitoxin module
MQEKYFRIIGVRKIIRKGNSKAVTLPSEVVRYLGLEHEEQIVFIQEGNKVRLEDVAVVSIIYDLFAPLGLKTEEIPEYVKTHPEIAGELKKKLNQYYKEKGALRRVK